MTRARPAPTGAIRMLGAGALAAATLAGCGAWRAHPPAPARAAQKIIMVEARVPRTGELPGLVGRMQHQRVAAGETLLDVARDAGLGFHELRDANRGIDEWVPPPATDVLVPSRWIVPRSRYRGLVVNIPEMRLYFFPPATHPGERVSVLTWPVGIGVEEARSPIGPFTVRSKDANPTWIVPASILRTMERPQRVVPPGPDNPLGAYRIRLSRGLYSIHGTNDPWSIGRLTTHGCIRLYPEDIGALFAMVEPGTPGELVYQPVKFGEDDGRVYAEVHEDVYRRFPDLERHAFTELARLSVAARVDPERLRAAVRERSGVPVDVSVGGPRAPAPAQRKAGFGSAS